MDKDNNKHYKFINSETGNVIYFLSVPAHKQEATGILESAKHRLAVENGIYIENIYYIEVQNGESVK